MTITRQKNVSAIQIRAKKYRFIRLCFFFSMTSLRYKEVLMITFRQAVPETPFSADLVESHVKRELLVYIRLISSSNSGTVNGLEIGASVKDPAATCPPRPVVVRCFHPDHEHTAGTTGLALMARGGARRLAGVSSTASAGHRLGYCLTYCQLSTRWDSGCDFFIDGGKRTPLHAERRV